ncbi:MAG: hybrid sensor histidine kinase/response regulator [Gammaproteobacteria bacterium]|nr:hybrid sensor histidine kinase/response regulator [Gammaproteobacteria bacterium]
MRASLFPQRHLTRPDPGREGLQQARFRVAVVGSVYAISIWGEVVASAETDLVGVPHLKACAGYLGMSIIVLILYEVIERARRLKGYTEAALTKVMLISDAIALTYFGVEAGDAAIIVAPIAITYVIGNGFRFGESYYLAAQALISVGVIVVLQFNSAVSSHPIAATAYLIALGFIPIYAIVLLNRHISLVEELARVSRERGALLKLLSHEIRSPLFNIEAAAEAISSSIGVESGPKRTPVDIQGHAVSISAMCLAINELCENTLASLKEGEAGGSFRLTYVENIFNLVRQTADEYHLLAISKKIHLTWVIHPDVVPYIQLRSGFLRTALENLIENAIKHNHSCAVHVSIASRPSIQNVPKLFVTVSACQYPKGAANYRSPRIRVAKSQKKAFGFGSDALQFEIKKLGGSIVDAHASKMRSCFSFEFPYTVPALTKNSSFTWGYCLYFGSEPSDDDLCFWSDAGYVIHRTRTEGWPILHDPDLQVDVIACRTTDALNEIRRRAEYACESRALPPAVLIVDEATSITLIDWKGAANYVVTRGVTKPSTMAAFRRQAISLTKPTSLQGLRILIVDDVPLITNQIARILSTAGAHTTQAHNETDAIQEIMHGRFDCLVVDAKIGSTHGHTIAEKYRASERGPCVVLLLSGATESISDRRLYDAVLTKGSAIECIVDKLSEAYAIVHQAQKPASDTAGISEVGSRIQSDLPKSEIERSLQQILIELNQLLSYIVNQHDEAKVERQRHRIRGLVDVILGPNSHYCSHALEEIINQPAQPGLPALRHFEKRLREAICGYEGNRNFWKPPESTLF